MAVRVMDEAGRVLQEKSVALAGLLEQGFDAAAVRDALKQLYATGRYADIRVEATPAEGGLRLDFIVRENFFINQVRVLGLDEPPSEALALSVLRLGLGETYTPSKLQEAVERLEQTLREEGFYSPHVESALAPKDATRQMDITLRVTPGKRARIGAITLSNRTEFADKTLLSKTKLKRGRGATSVRLGRAAERVRKFLADKGHLGARVAVRRGEYDAQSSTVPVSLEIVSGLKVRVEVSGGKVPEGELRQLVPIFQEGTVDEDLLREGRSNLRAYFEREGHFDSTVSYTVRDDEESGRRVIAYEVQRGPRRRLVGVALEGNKYFSDELLSSRLRIQPAGWLAAGLFNRRMLADDEAALREMYAANGFRRAQVRAELVEKYQGKEDALFVRFHIEEGPQTLVAALKLEGNAALANDDLLSYLGSTPGQPFSEYNVTRDHNNILALYFNEGFPEARMDAEAADTLEPNRVQLTYRISEGPQTRVAQVLVDGQGTTRREVIAREVRVEPGEPLRQEDVVVTQRQLYNLGVFSRVQVAPQNPQGSDPEKTMVVLVEEAKRYTIAYGGGLEVQRLGGAGTDPVGGEFRASPRGLFEISRANFLGRAHTVSLKLRGSALQGRALVSYAAPNFLARPSLSLLFTAFADKTRDVRTFAAQRYEGSVQLEQRISLATSLLYRYSYRHVLVDPNSLHIPKEQIPLFSQPTKISAPGITWIRDRRDNPADAARGVFNTADLSVAAKRLGSSASFVRLFVQNSTFHPLRRRVVFARSARLGIQEPLSDTTATQIPLPERFFAGGGNSLRGFGLNQAGPRDPQTGFPIGGLALLTFNQELRFPMRLPYLGERVGGALFYDAGNVYSRVERITFRARPTAAAVQSGELNYFSHTIGFGFRYATPIGPVRLDLGYQLNPARFNVDDGMGGTRPARLPRFQFFFNIGSIF